MPSSIYKSLAALGVLLSLMACSGGPSQEALAHLEGYWEIRRVEFPDGTEKEYTANTSVEYFSWDGKTGFRKKMQPTLEGTFLTSSDALPMQVVWRDKRLFLSFQGEETPWEEEVLNLEKDLLVTRHANGLKYEYSRYEPLITPEEDAQKRQ